MAGVDIQAKVRAGLSKAIAATSSATADLVYVVKTSTTAGTPINPGVTTETDVLLVNAIFKSFNRNLIDGTLIQDGDRQLVCNGDVELIQNEVIKVGGDRYYIVGVDVKNPSGVPLAYIAQVRVA